MFRFVFLITASSLAPPGRPRRYLAEQGIAPGCCPIRDVLDSTGDTCPECPPA
jgi:hypothetical protein